MHRPWVTIVLLAVAAGLAGACDTDDGRALAEPAPGQTVPPPPATTTTAGPAIVNPPVGSGDTSTMVLGSAAVASGGALPSVHSCIGDNVSPPLSWAGVPVEAVELAISLVDVSVESGRFVHWVVAGLDPTITGLAAGADVVALEGAVVARNDSTEFGWYGPCPPGGEQHTYVLTLYALGARSGVEPGATGADAIADIEATALATAVLDFTFTAP